MACGSEMLSFTEDGAEHEVPAASPQVTSPASTVSGGACKLCFAKAYKKNPFCKKCKPDVDAAKKQ
eukprot:12422094-Karenia_brevis.AAC.1